MDDQGDRQHTRKGPGVSCPNKTGNVACAGINVNLIIMYLIICCHILYFIILSHCIHKWERSDSWVLGILHSCGRLLIMLCVQGGSMGWVGSPLFQVVMGNIDDIVLQCSEPKRMTIGLWGIYVSVQRSFYVKLHADCIANTSLSLRAQSCYGLFVKSQNTGQLYKEI